MKSQMLLTQGARGGKGGHEGQPQASGQKAERVSPCDRGLTSLMLFILPSSMPYKIETVFPGLME